MKLINLARIDFGGIATGGKSKPEEVFDVQPTTSDQTITPTEGSVFSGGTVRAVTAAIDVNIASNNIKEGVTILGVAGNLKEEKPEESFNVQPTTVEQTITPTEGSVFSGGTVRAVTSAIDSNIQPENIKEGVTILGVVGTLSGGDTPDYRYMKGTIDKDGLRAIGWTDEDILTYEQNKAPHYAWQNDQYKVSDENKTLYNLDNPNYSSYKDNPNIMFIPNKNLDDYFSVNTFENMKYIKGIPFFNCLRMSMAYMFANCSSLTTIPSLNTYLAENMQSMFRSCLSLDTIPLINTSNVTDMNYMFYGCSNLTTIPQLNTSKVTDMANIFRGCTSLATIPQIDTSKVTNMNSMFTDCHNLSTIPQLDTSNVTNTSAMFTDCLNLSTIPQMDTSKVTSMGYMFNGCTSLTTVEGIDFSGLTSSLTRLFGSGSNKSKIARFIVNGKINVSISDNSSIKALTGIDYDSVKSILAAADRTDNTNAKTLAFNRTMTDRNGELAALVASCSTKGWTITGLTLQ